MWERCVFETYIIRCVLRADDEGSWLTTTAAARWRPRWLCRSTGLTGSSNGGCKWTQSCLHSVEGRCYDNLCLSSLPLLHGDCL